MSQFVLHNCKTSLQAFSIIMAAHLLHLVDGVALLLLQDSPGAQPRHANRSAVQPAHALERLLLLCCTIRL